MEKESAVSINERAMYIDNVFRSRNALSGYYLAMEVVEKELTTVFDMETLTIDTDKMRILRELYSKMVIVRDELYQASIEHAGY